MSVFDKRKERFDLILGVVKKRNHIEIERLVAVISVDLGMAERTVKAMVKTLVYADKLINEDGMLRLPKSVSRPGKGK